jgi:hypothetical protein
MKVVYTDAALENLAGILASIAAHYPTVYQPFRLRSHVFQDEPRSTCYANDDRRLHGISRVLQERT